MDRNNENCTISVRVKYSETRSKMLEIDTSSVKSHHQLLCEAFLQKTKADRSIFVIGGSLNTKSQDLLIYIFNQELQEEVEFEEGDKLFQNAKLTMKLKSIEELLLNESLEAIDPSTLIVSECETHSHLQQVPISPTPHLLRDRAGVSHRATDPTIRMYLPQLSSTLAEAEKEDCLKEHELNLIAELGENIQKLAPYPSKQQWNAYAKLAVERWPWLRDKNPVNAEQPWQVVKTRIERWVQNRRGKLRRIATKTKLACSATSPSLESDESSLSVSTSPNEEDMAFLKRREVMKANSTALIQKLVTLIPEYLDFQMISKDFYKLDDMKHVNKDVFIGKFLNLEEQLKKFVKQDSVYSKKVKWENLSQLEFLLEVNSLCSTKQGFKPPPPSLVISGKVCDDVRLFNDFVFPHSNIYLTDEGKISHQVIDCGGGVHFLDNDLLNEEKDLEIIFFQLLQVYYVFDTNYPACYGLLNLIDRYCLSLTLVTAERLEAQNEEGRKQRASKTKRKKAKAPIALDQFISKFLSFLETEAAV